MQSQEAIIVADLGSSNNKATSPKQVPSPISLRYLFFVNTFTLPDFIIYNLSPISPSLKTISFSLKDFIFISFTISTNLLLEVFLNNDIFLKLSTSSKILKILFKLFLFCIFISKSVAISFKSNSTTFKMKDATIFLGDNFPLFIKESPYSSPLFATTISVFSSTKFPISIT